MSESYSVAPAEHPGSGRQFELVNEYLQSVIESNPAYYGRAHREFDAQQRLRETNITEGQYVLGHFWAAEREFASGQLTKPECVRLMYGYPSSDTLDVSGSIDHNLVDSLYTNFNWLKSPHPTKHYRDIKADASYLLEHGETVRRDPARSTYEYTQLERAALVNGRDALGGVQLKLGPNLFANFAMGSIDDDRPHAHRSMTFVELIVKP